MSESLITDLSRAFLSKDGASLPSPGSGRERGPPPSTAGLWGCLAALEEAAAGAGRAGDGSGSKEHLHPKRTTINNKNKREYK